jgi:hypothetical protein
MLYQIGYYRKNSEGLVLARTDLSSSLPDDSDFVTIARMSHAHLVRVLRKEDFLNGSAQIAQPPIFITEIPWRSIEEP